MLLRTLLLLSRVAVVAVSAGHLMQGDAGGQATKLESCRPVAERTGVEGCWILASTPVGRLPAGRCSGRWIGFPPGRPTAWKSTGLCPFTAEVFAFLSG